MVGRVGIEPATPRLKAWRSTTELTALTKKFYHLIKQLAHNITKKIFFDKPQIKNPPALGG